MQRTRHAAPASKGVMTWTCVLVQSSTSGVKPSWRISSCAATHRVLCDVRHTPHAAPTRVCGIHIAHEMEHAACDAAGMSHAAECRECAARKMQD